MAKYNKIKIKINNKIDHLTHKNPDQAMNKVIEAAKIKKNKKNPSNHS